MRRSLAIVLLIGSVAPPAAAQTAFEISAGYSLAHDPRDSVTLPAGWIAGTALPITRAIAAVADVSGQYKTVPLFTGDARLSTLTVMGGVRASAGIGPLIEFAQIVVGAAHSTGSAFGSSSAATVLAVQPGLGVDWPLARRWAVRGQFDVRLLRSEPDATNGGYQTRAAFSLVYRRAR